MHQGFSGSSVVKNSPANAQHTRLIPGLGKIPHAKGQLSPARVLQPLGPLLEPLPHKRSPTPRVSPAPLNCRKFAGSIKGPAQPNMKKQINNF